MRALRLLLCACLLAAPAVHAGGIAFDLSLTGPVLSLVQRGDSTAFYPQAFRLAADGQWLALTPLEAPAELRPGATTRFAWGDAPPAERQTPLERLQPVMIRFFDQAGVYFGQISFFHGAPPAQAPLPARYADGALEIARPPAGHAVAATWVLAAREAGIAPISGPVDFTHRQPPARRIDWRTAAAIERIDTGAGLPTAFLLHETPAGLVQQVVPNGGRQGREQRTAWLDQSPRLFLAAKVAGGAGLALLLFGGFGRWRRGSHR